MKKIFSIALLSLSLSAFAKTEVLVAPTFVKISGAAAKEMYQKLSIKAVVDLDGGAGDDVFFKDGKHFRCFYSASADYYACDVFLK